MTSNKSLSYGCWDCVLPHMNFHPRFQIPAFSTLNKRIPIKIHYLELSDIVIQIDDLVYTKPIRMDLGQFSIKVLERFSEHKIVIQNLKVGVPLYGPSNLKFTIRNLSIYSTLYFTSNIYLWGAIKPLLTEISFPLQSLEISDHSLLDDDVIKKSQKLILKSHCQPNKVNHQRVHVRDQTEILNWLNNLISELIVRRYSIGRHFSLECPYYCKGNLQNLRQVHRAKESTIKDTKHGCCFTIPKNQEAEINVWEAGGCENRIINIRIDQCGTATLLE